MTTQPHPTLADARAWIEDGIADPEGLDAAGVYALELLGKLDEAAGLLHRWVYYGEVVEGMDAAEYSDTLQWVHSPTRTFLQSLKADSREEGS